MIRNTLNRQRRNQQTSGYSTYKSMENNVEISSAYSCNSEENDHDKNHKDHSSSHKKTRYCSSKINKSIDWLLSRRNKDGEPFLKPFEKQALELLITDYENSYKEQRTTMNWNGFLECTYNHKSKNSDNCTLHGSRLNAQERLKNAIMSMGPGLADVVVKSCIKTEKLSDIEKEMGWCPRSAKTVLKIALQRLSEFYQTRIIGDHPRNTARGWRKASMCS